jgi:sodium/potassium-transporting ATPase subunit alpha
MSLFIGVRGMNECSSGFFPGSAKGIVIRVGSETFMGKLASLASEMGATLTPIAKEMNRIIIIMTTVSLIFGVIFFGIGLSMKYQLIDTLFFVIGIVVANVPENLNVALTIILALTAKKLAAKNCVVKHLHAVETLGSASVICSDKTGTLTQNKMSVAHLWFSKHLLRIPNVNINHSTNASFTGFICIIPGNSIAEADTSEFATTGFQYTKSDDGFRNLANVAILCSRARFKFGQGDVPVLKRDVEGDASETAILKCMELQIGNVIAYRDACPKVCEIPFNSSNKYQVSIHDLKEPHDPRFLLVMKVNTFFLVL